MGIIISGAKTYFLRTWLKMCDTHLQIFLNLVSMFETLYILKYFHKYIRVYNVYEYSFYQKFSDLFFTPYNPGADIFIRSFTRVFSYKKATNKVNKAMPKVLGFGLRTTFDLEQVGGQDRVTARPDHLLPLVLHPPVLEPNLKKS